MKKNRRGLIFKPHLGIKEFLIERRVRQAIGIVNSLRDRKQSRLLAE